MSENEIRARAVRESAAYLDRVNRRGLISKQGILDDLETVACRMEQGMTARGSIRAAEVRSTDTTGLDRYDDFCPTCDAPVPTYTAECAVPFRTTNERGE